MKPGLFAVAVLPLLVEGLALSRKGADTYEGYLFAYFTGERYPSGEQIYFGASVGNDPLHWTQLNGGFPVLNSTLGTTGVRDPSIVRAPAGDAFYLLGTDLKIYGNGDWNAAQRHGSRALAIWESKDLVSWSEQRLVEVCPPEAGNTWAPEAVWDPEEGLYIVAWASKLYATTTDFMTFSEPQVYIDYGWSVIDTTFLRASDGRLYRFNKDERDPTSSLPYAKFVTQESSSGSVLGAWTLDAEGVGYGSIARGEGPTAFRSNNEEETYYLFIDEYGGAGYVPFVTNDIATDNWTRAAKYSLPARPRHGTVLPLTGAEYERIVQAYS